MAYAKLHIIKDLGEEHIVEIETAEDLGNSLNAIQGAIWNGTVAKATVIPIAEESKAIAKLFNQISGTIENNVAMSNAIRGKIVTKEEIR